MKYRMISASALPLALSLAGSAVSFRKPGDSVEVELSPGAAERMARYGAVRFEAVAEPAPHPAPEPERETPAPEHAEEVPLAPADLLPNEITLETDPAAE